MKKYIILALITILAAVLFTACDSDVKFNNDVAYTEILETDGAFVVNGKNYDSLQAAINAALEAGSSKALTYPKVTLTRDVNSHGVSIPKDAKVEIDLDGYTLTFVDVDKETGAVVVNKDAALRLSNGTVGLNEATDDLSLIFCNQSYAITLKDITVNVYDKQFSVYSEDSLKIEAEGDSTISGSLFVSGGKLKITGSTILFGDIISEDAYIYLYDDAAIAGDVYLLGRTIDGARFSTDEDAIVIGTVRAKGESVVTVEDDAYVKLYIANEADVYMLNGYLYVHSNGHVYLENVDNGSLYVASEPDSAITAPEDIPVIPGKYSIETKDGVTYFADLVEAVREAEEIERSDEDVAIFLLSDDDQDYSEETIAITKELIINLNGHKIENAEEAVLDIADNAILFLTSVDKEQDYEPTADMGVFGASFTGEGHLVVDNVKINGSIKLDGNLQSRHSEFEGTITVANLDDGYIKPGSIFHDDIKTEGSALFYGSEFVSNSEADADIEAGESVRIRKSIGYAGSITAKTKVEIDNEEATNPLNIGAITAFDGTYYQPVTIYSNDQNYVVVWGEVNASFLTAGEKDRSGAIFKDSIHATEAAFINNSTVDSETVGDINATVIYIYNSVLDMDVLTGFDNEPAEYIHIEESKGLVGNIVSKFDIFILGGEGKTLETGNIEAFDGKDQYYAVALFGTKKADEIVVKGNIIAETVVAGDLEEIVIGATFKGDITATDAVYLYNSSIGDSAEDDIVSPEVTIAYSTLNVGKITGPDDKKASTVEIKNPLPIVDSGLMTAPYFTVPYSYTQSTVDEILVDDELSITKVPYDDNYDKYALKVNKIEACEDVFIDGGNYYSLDIDSYWATADISGGYFENVIIKSGADANISGGTFGDFTFDSTNFNGTFKATSGTFTGKALFKGGYAIFDGDCTVTISNNVQAIEYDLSFADIRFGEGQYVIKSAAFEAKSISQLNSIGTRIVQDDAEAGEKYVVIMYTGNLDAGEAVVKSSTSFERIAIQFGDFTTGTPTYYELTGNAILELGSSVVYQGKIYINSTDKILASKLRILDGLVFTTSSSGSIITNSDLAPTYYRYWYKEGGTY